jgi:hypothetical protein
MVPYWHKKLPAAVEVTGAEGSEIPYPEGTDGDFTRSSLITIHSG